MSSIILTTIEAGGHRETREMRRMSTALAAEYIAWVADGYREQGLQVLEMSTGFVVIGQGIVRAVSAVPVAT